MLLFQLKRKKQRRRFFFYCFLAVVILVTAYLLVRFIEQLSLNQTYRTKSKADNSSIIPQVLWGAYISGSTYGSGYGNTPWDQNTWNVFESHTHKKVSILHWGQPWYTSTAWPNSYYPFVSSLMDTVRSRGAIPMIDWASWDSSKGSNQPEFALKNITNGDTYVYAGQTFDSYVTQWAQAARDWGHPFFLRFNWEMNGWWKFPWATAADPNSGIVVNNNTAQDYINAWRHVHDIFTKVGANNVTWVWCPNISSVNTIPMSQLYPGDAYVDWICLDGYNKDLPNWYTFSQVFSGTSFNGNHDSYAEITSLTLTKPLMIGEWATNEVGDGGTKKAEWISDALQVQIPQNYPRIGAVVWFNWNSDPGSSYVVESSLPAQYAFSSGINLNYYVAGSTDLQITSPIRALPPLIPTVNPSLAVSPSAYPTVTNAPVLRPPPPTATLIPSPTSASRCCSFNRQGKCMKRC